MQFRFLLFSGLAGLAYALAYPNALGVNSVAFLLPSQVLLWFSWLSTARFTGRLSIVFCFFICASFLGFNYIPFSLVEFFSFPVWKSWIYFFVFVLIICLPYFIFTTLDMAFRRFGKKTPIEIQLLIYAGVLSGLEYYFPQLIPIFAGAPWIELASNLGLASVGGVAIFSFFTYFTSLIIARSFVERRIFKLSVIPIVLFIILNAFNWMPRESRKEKLAVRLVQANIGNFLKLESEKGSREAFQEVLGRYRKLSRESSELEKLDLIVWPETSYPRRFQGTLLTPETALTEIPLNHKADFVLGGYDADPVLHDGKPVEFNSVIHFNPAGAIANIYHKNILLPFAEANFKAGVGTPLFELKNGMRFITPICYEVLRPDYIRQSLGLHSRPAHFILTLSNDSWFGRSAENEQHPLLARWRALENRIPVIRSTNTGITSVYFPDGTSGPLLKWGQEDFLDMEVPISELEAPTIFQKCGFFSTVVAWIICALILLVGKRMLRN